MPHANMDLHLAPAAAVRDTAGPSMNQAALRTERLIIVGLFLLRAAQLGVSLPIAASGLSDGHQNPAVIIGGVLAYVVWSIALLRTGLARNRLTDVWVVADAVIVTILEIPVALSVSDGHANWYGWTWLLATNSAMLAFVYLRWRVAGVIAALIVIGYVTGAWYGAGNMNAAWDWPTMTSGVGAMLSFGIFGGGVVRLLRRSAQTTDEATAAAVAATAREAARQARFEERTNLYKMLHDTVLHTLTKVARGGLDYRTADVQALCERDATYLRSLITGSDNDSPTSLAAALADIVRDRSALGLQVHCQFHALPATLPQPVTDAIVNATREALNNISTHAGTDEAWLTAVGRPQNGVSVTVVDRGVGFDPAKTAAGGGLIRSIRHRIEEIRGTASVDSVPGDGTVVELSWTP